LLITSGICVKPVPAKSKAEKETEFIQKVKTGIAGLGVGKDARVAVKLRDRTELTGYIGEVAEDSFVIRDTKTGIAITVTYANVAQVKGHNISRNASIVIRLAIVAAILVLVAIAAKSSAD